MNTQLYKNLTDVLTNKTENEAREYIVKHFSEFPENMQGDIVRGFFEEGLLRLTDKNQAIDDMQERGLKMINELVKEKKQ